MEFGVFSDYLFCVFTFGWDRFFDIGVAGITGAWGGFSGSGEVSVLFGIFVFGIGGRGVVIADGFREAGAVLAGFHASADVVDQPGLFFHNGISGSGGGRDYIGGDGVRRVLGDRG